MIARPTFTERKDDIDQAISSITASSTAWRAIESLVRQLKGIANTLKSADSHQLDELRTQYNDLRTKSTTWPPTPPIRAPT